MCELRYNTLKLEIEVCSKINYLAYSPEYDNEDDIRTNLVYNTSTSICNFKVNAVHKKGVFFWEKSSKMYFLKKQY